MRFANAKFAKVLRLTAYPLAVAALGLILFSRVARTGDDANAIAVRLIVVNSADDAQSIEDDLKAGADFAVLAREKSVDPDISRRGLSRKNRSRFAAGRIERRAARRTTWAPFKHRQITNRLRDSAGIDGSGGRESGKGRPRAPGRHQRRRQHPAGPACGRTG